MIVSILSIGDELLIGQTINTNAAWLGKELSLIGARIQQVLTISDDEHVIRKAIEETTADLCIVTGGLGPTKDDRTKKVLASYFDMPLVENKETLDHITDFFERRNRPMLQVNIDQALLPQGCEILPNRLGTAAGMWFKSKGKSVISLPGVPYEMKAIFQEEILPRLSEHYHLNALYHQTVITHGMGESFLAERIADWETSLEAASLSLAYLPSPGIVKLRIGSHKGKVDKELIAEKIRELQQLIPEQIVGYGEDTLSSVVAQLLTKNNKMVGTVESCTAGSLATSLVGNSGSSHYFRGSFLTYQTHMKSSLLDIEPEFIALHDVVSEEVVLRMAEAGRERLGVDYCLSTTGIMGPTSGDSNHAVGTVWIGLAGPSKTVAKKFQFGDNRQRNIEMSTLAALNLLRLALLED
ncbi:MAG: CinA family nicotinamide mononucleotide deamidase-related protein [Flavobacteriales bacterium]